jgi:hypothetical protein
VIFTEWEYINSLTDEDIKLAVEEVLKWISLMIW